MTTTQRQFNSTAAGQRVMCNDAASRANAFIMAAWLRKRGIPTYDDSMIASAGESLLASIKEDLLTNYNAALKAEREANP